MRLNPIVSRFLLVQLLLLFSGTRLLAGTGEAGVSVLAEKLNRYVDLTYPQKLFLASDREIYFQGDTLWFSGWLTQAATHEPDSLERILYVEVYDAADQLLLRQLFPIEKGRVKGQLVLPDLGHPATLSLQAFTNFMRNAGSDFYFKKEILLLGGEEGAGSAAGGVRATNYRFTSDKSVSPSSGRQQKEHLPVISLLPEGGTLTAGLPARVAFVAVSPGGQPLSLSGTLVDQSDSVLAFVHSDASGRGLFSIRPEVDQTYALLLKGLEGQSTRHPLPEVQAQGYGLRVDHPYNSTVIQVSIFRSPKQTEALLLALSQRGQLIQAYEIPEGNSPLALSIDKAQLQPGIVHLTLFNARLQPQLERLVFIAPENHFIKPPLLETDGQRLKISLDPGRAADSAFESGFAVGLSSLGRQQTLDTLELDAWDMEQYFYLHSELPGLEQDCSYFFEKDFASHRQADLAMMTNGWRRFKWEEVLKGRVPELEHQLETGFYLSGSVKQSIRNPKPVSGVGVTLMGSGAGVFAGASTTEEDGRFVFEVEDFVDTIEVVVQTRNTKGKTKDFHLSVDTNMGPLVYGHVVSPDLAVGSDSKEATGANGRWSGEKEAYNALVQALSYEEERLKMLQGVADSGDVLLDEVEIIARKRMSPLEKMHALYGKEDYAVGEDRMLEVNEEEAWNFGLFSVLEHILPDLSLMSGRWGSLRKEEYPVMPLMPEHMLAVDERLNLEDLYSFRLEGAPNTRLYIYVDGRLSGFTNHKGHLDWALSGLQNLSLSNISSIGVIRRPARSPLGEAIAVPKMPNECYCPDFLLPYFVNNSPEAHLQANSLIVSVHTKDGVGLGNAERNSGLFKTRLLGFTKAREFYQPPVVHSSSQRFFAPTLYWHPNLTPNAAGELVLELDPSLLPDEFLLKIWGLSSGGRPLSRTFFMNKQP